VGIARYRCGVMIAAVAAVLGQLVAFPAAAQAGFFDFLFGWVPQAPAARYFGARPHHWHGRHWGGGLAFRRHEHEFSRGRLIVADRADHPQRPQGPVDLMDDESLRKGDAVMTPNGIRIFVGYSGSSHHAPEDFRIPSEVKGLSKRERKAFAGLDAQGSGTGVTSGAVSGRSAIQRDVSVGQKITDSNGRTIRYVGP
jgi:hypothetical protein